ncbi:ATP-binding cassette domain-containing protein [Octadecabacter sp. 1_MG-2023]|uniref:ATP-binding cassette domain-containing protein n=1 Tax=unclassified Octadecabacter TaxID=196158 RepID=UPI001C0A33A2|nr:MULTISPECIES: ATP-binding cassette domain-containing protein [unclassified Octadecabacter]MBU2992356.1 ATP-binding cassette domain-containing protein [Octadecabacter sp. B2R22]MDO6734887.1 ATP-binding cassette domain-containing protein [Octadecabacter sp. 1_MG-2023]
MNKSLSLRNVCILRDGIPLIEVDHEVSAGEVLSVMGPSGVGKSTLLAYITGNLHPVFKGMGEVLLNGNDITGLPPHKREIGILFQDDLLFPHMSVGENLAFGIPRGGSRAERRSKIENALCDVGLDGFSDRDPATLSGGQRARVALVRMLLSDPKALLLDEAFSRLDAELRAHVRELVFRVVKERNLPVLMVTHDLEDAKSAGGPIIELESYTKK